MRKRFYPTRSRPSWSQFQGHLHIFIVSLRWVLLMLIGIMLVGAIGAMGWEIWSSWHHSKWDGERQFTLVYEAKNQLGYIRFNPELAEIKRFTFPDNAMIFLAQGYEAFRADKVKLLSAQEGIALGTLLQKSMTIFLGSMTDGYVTHYTQSNPTLDQLLWATLLKQTKSNLSTWDTIRLLWFMQSLDGGEIVELEFANTQVLQPSTLPDGTQVFIAQDTQLDNFAIKELADPLFLKQALSWEIFNATTHTGLGERMARIIHNSGFDVVGVRQATDIDNQQNTQIQIRSNTPSKEIIQMVAHYFDFEIASGNVASDRADVAIVLGEDFWRWGFSR